jgi:hypothetical protein
VAGQRQYLGRLGSLDAAIDEAVGRFLNRRSGTSFVKVGRVSCETRLHFAFHRKRYHHFESSKGSDLYRYCGLRNFGDIFNLRRLSPIFRRNSGPKRPLRPYAVMDPAKAASGTSLFINLPAAKMTRIDPYRKSRLRAVSVTWRSSLRLGRRL